MHRVRVVLLAIAAIGLHGCGDSGSRLSADASTSPSTTEPASGDATAIAACKARSDYRDSTLRSAFDSTVGELKAWLDSRQPANWGHVVHDYERDRPDSDPMSVCWVDDGALAFPGVLEANPGRPRAVLVVDALGSVSFLFGGYFGASSHADLKIVRPPKG